VKVLVIGGTLFIGRHIVEVLLKEGHTVTVLNRGQTADDASLAIERLRADRSVPGSVAEAVRGHHFDAVVDVIGFTRAQLEETIGAFRGRIERYVFISSVAVYGYEQFELYPVTESTRLNPTGWAYGQGKIDCENALIQAEQEHGFPFVSLRPAQVYGRYNSNAPEWEFRYFARLQRGRPILMPEDGGFIFHPVDGRDVATAVLAAMTAPAALGRAYNIAGPTGCTADAWMRVLGAVSGSEPMIVRVPGAQNLPWWEGGGATVDVPGKGPQRFWPLPPTPTHLFSIDRAKHDLGWTPTVGLVEGHRGCWDWYHDSGAAQQEPDFTIDDTVLAHLRG
jgi:nucleoside-diphosphate-sugar epimerase